MTEPEQLYGTTELEQLYDVTELEQLYGMTELEQLYGMTVCCWDTRAWINRVGQNHIYTVYIRYFWLGNHQIYGVYIRIYTVLANPMDKASWLPILHPHPHPPSALYATQHKKWIRRTSRTNSTIHASVGLAKTIHTYVYTVYIYMVPLAGNLPYMRSYTVCIYVGLVRTIYIHCTNVIFDRQIPKYTVIYGVYIRFWPTLHIRFWPTLYISSLYNCG